MNALKLAAIALMVPTLARAQSTIPPATLPPAIQQFVAVNAPVVALTHVRLVDGSGRAAQSDMTIIIRGDKIAAVGPSATTKAPDGARIIDATGKSVIPGIVGLHDHMYWGGMRFEGETYARLYLSAGVTTIRTTGSVDSYRELTLKRMIDSLALPGPSIVVTGPYLQGAPMSGGAMKPLTGPDDARRVVRYWAEEGVTWFKAYTSVTRDELAAAIDEAHKHGVKVTAHLCSIGYREAAALGIDQLEHGLFANYEYFAGKQADKCPMGQVPDSAFFMVDANGPEVQRTIRELIQRKVAITSTLDVMELNAMSRLVVDPRVFDAVNPALHASQLTRFYDMGKKIAGTREDGVQLKMYKNAMAFERAFVKAGGLMGAGSDPCCGPIIAGYGDQRNYELLIEAGFTPEESLQIMTQNGAKILGFDKTVGMIKPGMQADLVLLRGDVVATPASIRNTEIVFRRGIGFDSAKLRESVRGKIGS